jgi:oxygen-independent coproporphyrinogen-3 oxidase
MLGMDNLKRIMSKLKPYINKKTEISIELNPEHLEKKQKTILKNLENLGFNRISIGVQTINKKILKKIERNYEKEELIKTIDEIRKRKITLSLDFMFGLPSQSIKDLKNDLDFVKQIMPEHISFYSFTPPDRYKLVKECASDELSCKMFDLISSELGKSIYKHYEVSNFCLGSKKCSHNMAYWQRRSYIGLGAGAHSFDKNKKTRSWNKQDIISYIKHPLQS